MSPLQPMLWTLIVVAFAVGARWLINRPSSGRLDVHHADRMSAAESHMWWTGECTVCDSEAFDHADGCALHVWLGGDGGS
tara:strand:+ start:432 stop:671 length:240 start_codon:yes stop_codon:yes gene_type:complete